MDASLFSTDVKFSIKGERPSLSSRLFYEPRSRYIANQSGSAKETIVLFVLGHKIGLWLISIILIKLWWINSKIEYKYIQSNNFIVSYLLYCIIYLFRQRDCKKKVSARGRLVAIFYFTQPVDRRQTILLRLARGKYKFLQINPSKGSNEKNFLQTKWDIWDVNLKILGNQIWENQLCCIFVCVNIIFLVFRSVCFLLSKNV